MADRIDFVPLRKLSMRITKGTTPTRGQGFVSRGINYVKSEAITPDGKIDTSKFAQIDEATHKALARSQLYVGNVLFSMAGVYLGKTAVVQPEHIPANTNQAVGIITVDESKADPRFIHYSIQSPSCRAWILKSAAQSAQPNFNLKEIGDLPIPRFELKEQRAIANILGALDDKIELNRRRNQTLEAMARALFKDWFVDFGPVRAKMEGREPYLPADLWQLFPDRLDEEDKPEGWKEVAAETVSDLGIGKTPPRKEHQWFSETDTDMRWVSIRDMGDSGVFLQITSEYLTKEAVQKFNVRVVPDNTVILSFKLTVGRVAITDGEMVTNEAIAHLKVGEKGSLTTEYLYSYLREFDYGRLGSTSSIATAVNSKSIKALPVLVPSNDLVGHFTRRVASIFADIKQLQSEAATLAQLRDTLLPKLIYGELRIADAEKFLERVA